jgi:hypothetical protein
MTDLEQFRQDVSFIRQAINRRSGAPPAKQICYLVWAAYVLIGFALIDQNPHYANWFFLIAFPLAALLTWWLGRRKSAQMGDADLECSRRTTFHFYGGVILAILAANALGMVIPGLSPIAVGQILVVLIGTVYFLAGVHIDAHFLWLGPLLIVGALLVRRIPEYPWTCIGVVFAFGLSVPYLVSLLGHGKNR